MSLDQTYISERAMEWARRVAGDDFTTEEAADFERWLLVDPRHLDAFSDACRDFARVRQLSREQVAAIVALPEQDSPEHPTAASVPRWRTYAFAASIAVATVLLGLLLFTGASNGWFGHTYQTPTAKVQTLTLPDGSSVHLNARTKIRWWQFRGQRHVRLISGQALFHVAHDDAHPFDVNTGAGRVRVIGTQFDINRLGDETVLSVLEGIVDVQSTNPDRPWHRIVSANQGMTYGANGPIEDVHSVNVSKAVSWRKFVLDLNRTPLSAAIEQLSRYTDQPIVLTDERLKTYRLVGTLHVRDLEEALGDLEVISPIVVRKDKDGAAIYLDPRPVKPQ